MPPRAPQTRPELLDLSEYYNASLNVSWSELGGPDLSELLSGKQNLGGINFDIRGLIQVAGDDQAAQSETEVWRTRTFPARVLGMQVGRRAARLHFLQASRRHHADGEQIGTYILHFKNQQRWEIPIVYGQDLRRWTWQPGDDEQAARAEAVWKGQSPSSRKVGLWLRLYKRTWENPSPDVEIESIDFIAGSGSAQPFLVAVTAE